MERREQGGQYLDRRRRRGGAERVGGGKERRGARGERESGAEKGRERGGEAARCAASGVVKSPTTATPRKRRGKESPIQPRPVGGGGASMGCTAPGLSPTLPLHLLGLSF
jgi:hypothetical protein